MNYIVKISWDSGGCELIADKFFPTTLEKTRKLFKLLVTDPAWSDEQVNELLDYFGKRKVEESEKAITTQFKADYFKEQAEVIKKQCSPRSEKYQEYMRLRDQAVLFSRESREHLNASKYFLKAFVLLCDMWGGKTT